MLKRTYYTGADLSQLYHAHYTVHTALHILRHTIHIRTTIDILYHMHCTIRSILFILHYAYYKAIRRHQITREAPQKPPGATGNHQEPPGGTGRHREARRATRSHQEAPGGTRKPRRHPQSLARLSFRVPTSPLIKVIDPSVWLFGNQKELSAGT